MLENFGYCPTLYSRVAEIKALAQLPAPTKDRLFPIIVARPWPNAKQLSRTWEKIAEALGPRRYALDLDKGRRNSGANRPAAVEFDRLFDNHNGYENYYRAVSEINGALPVLRVSDSNVQLSKQLDHIGELDRGCVLRIKYGEVQNPFPIIDDAISQFEDLAIFVDAGWSRDLLGREAWVGSIVEHASRVRPEIEMVVCGSSFPDSFQGIGERGVLPVEERYLFNNLSRRYNAAALTYGDWGSTREPTDPVPMRNVPRIDLPTPANWISFRRDKAIDDEEDYAEIARRVVADPEWPADLKIWGTYTIDWTARGEPGAIRSPATAAAARINIHLHRQAYFGGNDVISDGDEPFTDEF